MPDQLPQLHNQGPWEVGAKRYRYETATNAIQTMLVNHIFASVMTLKKIQFVMMSEGAAIDIKAADN